MAWKAVASVSDGLSGQTPNIVLEPSPCAKMFHFTFLTAVPGRVVGDRHFSSTRQTQAAARARHTETLSPHDPLPITRPPRSAKEPCLPAITRERDS